jgi:hypothetical protein
MSNELQDYIDKCLSDILFNGCKIPSSTLKLYFENACLMAQNEHTSKMIYSMFEKKEIGEHNIL